MIKHVLIDIDNTILDFNKCSEEAIKRAAEIYNLSLPDNAFQLFCIYNDKLWQRVERGDLSFDGLREIRWNYIFEKMGVDFDGRVFEDTFRDCLNHGYKTVDGAEEALCYLSGKYKVSTASNGPHMQQCNRIAGAGLDKYIYKYFNSGLIGFNKPDRRFFDYCVKELGAGVGEIIMIGDSLTADIIGAAEYGFVTCYFNKFGEQKDCPVADYIIDDLIKVTDIL